MARHPHDMAMASQEDTDGGATNVAMPERSEYIGGVQDRHSLPQRIAEQPPAPRHSSAPAVAFQPKVSRSCYLATLAECRSYLDARSRVGVTDIAAIHRLLHMTCADYFAAVDAGDSEAADFLYQTAEQFGALAGGYFLACEAYRAD